MRATARRLATAIHRRFVSSWPASTPDVGTEGGGPRAEPVPAYPGLPGGSIDYPPAGTVLSTGVLRAEGWAATAAGPCSRVELTLDGRPIGRARLGGVRPDVGRATSLLTAALSGFQLMVELSEVDCPPGDVELGGRGVGMDGCTVVLPDVAIVVTAMDQAPRSRPPASVKRISRLSGHHQRPGAMRLLVCSHDLNRAGAQLFLADLMSEICDQGPISGLVMSLGDGPVRESFERLGFEVNVWPPFPIMDSATYEARAEEVMTWVKRSRCDVALVNTVDAFPAADVCLRLGLPTVWAIHESYRLPVLWATYENRLDPQVRERADAALGAADTLAFLCDETRACYEPYLPSSECVTLPYGVDVAALDGWRATFDRAQARSRQGIPEDGFILLCVGTIDPHKSQILLIQAFAWVAERHPEATLQLVGGYGSKYEEAVRLAAAQYGLQERVRIQPLVADVRPWYGIADLVVSASDRESVPRSMLEAMALGVPVLGTSVFGVPGLISDGETGWLCEPRDVEALACAIDRVLNLHAAERQRVAHNAHRMVENRYRSDVRAHAWGDLLRARSRATHSPQEPGEPDFPSSESLAK